MSRDSNRRDTVRREPVRTQIEAEVRYAETDAMGVVHHSRYYVWFELARTRLCSRSGWHYAEIEELGYLLLVTRTECRYRAAARYGDTVTVDAWVEKLGSRGVRFAYEVRRRAYAGRKLDEPETVATGATEHVWVDRETRRPRRMPEELRGPFQELAGS